MRHPVYGIHHVMSLLNLMQHRVLDQHCNLLYYFRVSTSTCQKLDVIDRTFSLLVPTFPSYNPTASVALSRSLLFYLTFAILLLFHRADTIYERKHGRRLIIGRF